jgi:hypothetical protein
MPVPALATKFEQTMDPTDLVDFEIDVTGRILEVGELASSYTLTLLAEAVALGLKVAEGVADLGNAAYAPQLVTGNKIQFWLYVEAANRNDAAYTAGVTLGMELTVNTNNTPPRRRQRSFSVEVVHQ